MISKAEIRKKYETRVWAGRTININKTADANAWVMKYFRQDSVACLEGGLIVSGMKERVLISRANQAKTQESEVKTRKIENRIINRKRIMDGWYIK